MTSEVTESSCVAEPELNRIPVSMLTDRAGRVRFALGAFLPVLDRKDIFRYRYMPPLGHGMGYQICLSRIGLSRRRCGRSMQHVHLSVQGSMCSTPSINANHRLWSLTLEWDRGLSPV